MHGQIVYLLPFQHREHGIGWFRRRLKGLRAVDVDVSGATDSGTAQKSNPKHTMCNRGPVFRYIMYTPPEA